MNDVCFVLRPLAQTTELGQDRVPLGASLPQLSFPTESQCTHQGNPMCFLSNLTAFHVNHHTILQINDLSFHDINFNFFVGTSLFNDPWQIMLYMCIN